jgi:hypothetical protein
MAHRSLRDGLDSGQSLTTARGVFSWRRLAALHALSFLLAVAFAPHRHVNSFEDLLSDGPSDSGIFVAQPTGSWGAGPCFGAARIVDDDACLACFQNDFSAATEPVGIFRLTTTFAPLAAISVLRSTVVTAAPVAPSHSRAPPPTA